MSKIQELVESIATKTFIEHVDVTKCGHCWKEKIKSEVANEYLKAGKLSAENLKEMFVEIDVRWKQTELFLRVKELLEEGKSIEMIAQELEGEGIII